MPTFLVESVFVATCHALNDMVMSVETSVPHLGKNIVHGLTCSHIAFAQQTHEAQDLDLEKWICDARDVVFGTVSCGHESLQMSDK